jgi:hypothetical protein
MMAMGVIAWRVQRAKAIGGSKRQASSLPSLRGGADYLAIQ